jgi:hypothetical protein
MRRKQLSCALAVLVAIVAGGCAMSMGKTTEYREDGTVSKVSEDRSNASTTQSVITVFGVRIKTFAPASTDAAPIELDLGLARGAVQVVPIGESAQIHTNGDIFGAPINHAMSVNTPDSRRE